MPSRHFFEKYARQLNLPSFGLAGQQKLGETSVLIIGAGGLGCPLLTYLAAAGIGKIGIVDFDVVEVSNLHRQVLYSEQDIGKQKALVAKEKLQQNHPELQIEAFCERLSTENVFRIFGNFDIIADGSDNFPTRYLVNDACVIAGKPLVYGSVYQMEGQVSVFNLKMADSTFSPNYRDLFPTPPSPGLVPDCEAGGVLGVLPGIIGSMQALEIIKIAAGFGQPLAGRLLLFDGESFVTRILKFTKNPDNVISKLMNDYEDFCGTKQNLKEISVTELREWQLQNIDFQLIDVRETFEFEAENLGGISIPLRRILAEADKISTKKKVVVYCQVGMRSAYAIAELEVKLNFKNLWNLAGGLVAWKSEFGSPSIKK